MPTDTYLKPLAELLPAAVERFPGRVAVRHRAGGDWHDVTFAEVSEIVTQLALGLLALGVAPGERVALLCATRPEWMYCDLAITLAGAVVVPIYPTSSAEECEWVLADSGAVAVIAETPAQVALAQALRGSLPALRDVVAIDALDSLRARGSLTESEELAARGAAVAPDDPYTIIYTSGTTGRAKGCVLTHGNYRAMLDMVHAGAAADTVTETYSVPGTYTLTIPQYASSVNVIANGAGGGGNAGDECGGGVEAFAFPANGNRTPFADITGPATGLAAPGRLAVAPPLSVRTAKLPPARAGHAYAATLRANLGTMPYRWHVRSLPRGLRLRAGRIVGRPAHAGIHRLTVRVGDASHPTMRAGRRLTLKVAS